MAREVTAATRTYDLALWLLRHANLRLDRLRYLVWLSKDLRLLSVARYSFAASAIHGIGAEIAGWLRQQGGMGVQAGIA